MVQAGPHPSGHVTVSALKCHTEEESSKKIRMVVAYTIIKTWKYAGPTIIFSLSGYIQKHCSAHAKLAELRNQILESKKVDNFLKGLTNPRFKNIKENVIGYSLKNGNFTNYHQYI